MNFQKTQAFFLLVLSPSNEKSAFWRFLPCCSFGLLCFSLASKQNLDPDNHQASCHSFSLWNVWKPPADFTRKKWHGFVCDFLASAQMDSSKELWLGLIRRRCHPHYCVKYCCKKHSGRQEGDLSLWLWLIQARGSTLGLQTRVCCHTRFIYNSSFGLLPWHTTFPLQA